MDENEVEPGERDEEAEGRKQSERENQKDFPFDFLS